jgi:hypothetical protein
MRPTLLFLVLILSSCGTQPPCGPSTCAGCCSSTNKCIDGVSASACGGSGSSCDTCVGVQTCVAGRCSEPQVAEVDGGAPDVGSPDAGSPDAGSPNVGIEAPTNETWSWVEVPGTKCGRGTTTGLGVNLTSRSRDVLIFMNGGGACWNDSTCRQGLAADLDGYGATKFANEINKGLGIFNRSNVDNPFRNASFIFVPYCTGDIHSGDALAPYGVHHRGAVNVREDLLRLAATFPGQRTIWLMGVSTGGYGVQFNYHRFAEAFPNAEVHALADSAQMIHPTGTLGAQFVSAWNTSNPPGCPQCTTDFTQVPAWLSRTYPNRRFGLLAFSQDAVLAQFFGYQLPSFEAATTLLLTSQYQNQTNLKYYVVDPVRPSHVLLGSLATRSVSGVLLSSWLTRWATGTPGWENVRGP